MVDNCLRLILRGSSGREHRFTVHPRGTRFHDRPGLYAICKPVRTGWFVGYVGQSNGLDGEVGSAFGTHPKADAALRLGYTHVAAASFTGPQEARLAAAADLIAGLKPPLNGGPAPTHPAASPPVGSPDARQGCRTAEPRK